MAVKRPDAYLTVEEVVYWQGRVKFFEKMLEEIKSSEYKTVRSLDAAEQIKGLRNAQKILAEKSPPVSQVTERDKMKRRAMELERLIADGMPSKDQMMGERKAVGNGKYCQEAREEDIRQQMDWETKKRPYVNEWIRIMRILEPNNPQAADVERLRRLH